MLEEILDRRNIERALVQVESNKGAAGVDKMQCSELRAYISDHWQALRQRILEGNYKPMAVRKVEIPKPQGGTRSLGIPTVIDRLLQQSIAQWLGLKYEPEFCKTSYGFRPNRNAHQAVLQALEYLNEGKVWVLELDLENFFDKVNHDRLMSTLSKKIDDKRTLKLIRSYLTSGIMEGGVISVRNEGTPQGSPLSPLLSNIVLDELDKELEDRGHSFVRYADDVSVYLSSETSAKRVMTSIAGYIEMKLLLKVNVDKTKVSKPEASTLLGFSFRKHEDKWIISIAWKSAMRMRHKIKAITLRSKSISESERIAKLNLMIRGWVNYFMIAMAKVTMESLDKTVRSRLRMCQWKQWKTTQARRANLLRLGASRRDAYEHGGSSAGYSRLAHSWVLCKTLPNMYFKSRGYVGFSDLYRRLTGTQLPLF